MCVRAIGPNAISGINGLYVAHTASPSALRPLPSRPIPPRCPNHPLPLPRADPSPLLLHSGAPAPTPGYEWFVMTEAKARNPDIVLYGLPWAFPHYLTGNGSYANPLANPDTPQYIADWIGCAKAAHNLTIDYIGVWNEKDAEFADAGVAYIKALRKVLDARGFGATKIIAGDVHSWAPENEVLSDPELAGVVDVLCRHYPSTASDAAAKQTGKPLWSSEDYAASNTGAGGRCEGRILNQNWVNGLMTATINWNLVSSYYKYQAWSDDGFSMTARSPWTGHYELQPPLWMAAHTTQFTWPGMRLLPTNQSAAAAAGTGAAAGSGWLAAGGSFVTYTDGGNVSIVIEKVAPEKSGCGFSSTPHYAVADETVSIRLAGPSATIKALSVWRSSFAAGTFFEQQPEPVTVGPDGLFRIQVATDEVVTLSSLTGQRKGNTTGGPVDANFPVSYADDFDHYADGSNADYFTAMSGAFDVTVGAAGGGGGGVLRQAAVGFPIKWLRDDLLPFAVIGDGTWKRPNVTAAFMLEQPGTAAFVGAALTGIGCDAEGPILVVGEAEWFLTSSVHGVNSTAASDRLVHGTISPPLRPGSWHSVGLRFTPAPDYQLLGTLDGAALFARPQPDGSATGAACLGAAGYYPVQYDNFTVKAAGSSHGPPPSPPGPGPSPPAPAPAPATGCTAPRAGQNVQVFGCAQNATDAHQAWQFAEAAAGGSRIQLASNPALCMTTAAAAAAATLRANASAGQIRGAGAAAAAPGKPPECSGDCVVLGPCDGAPRFQPSPSSNRDRVLPSLAECLDVDLGPGHDYRVELFRCNTVNAGGRNQQFEFDQATGILSPLWFGSMQACVAVCGR